MNQAIFVVLLVLLCAFTVQSEFVNPIRTARLDSSQVINAIGIDDAVAAAVCTYARYSSPPTLECLLQNDYILTQTTIISIAIYNGPRGINGPLLYLFDNSTYTSNFNSDLIVLADIGSYNVSSQINDFLNGQWYIQINVAIPDYSIRGQLENSDRFVSVLNSENTIPPAGNTNSFGVLLAVYTYNQPRRTLQFEIVHNVENPISLEFREALNGNYGTFVFSLSDYRSPIFENVQITVEEQGALLTEDIYAQVNSIEYNWGEIRGQIQAIDYLPTPKFTARMTGDQAIPAVNTQARGCGLVSFDCTTSTMEYLIVHTVSQPTAASVLIGIPGQVGTLLSQLPTSVSPIYGSLLLTETQALRLFNESLYFLIQSTPFISGEIRGQISTTFNYYSYLSGINVNPPVTSASVGCGTYRIIGDVINKLDFEIIYNTPNPWSVYFMEGQPDVNGPLNRVLSNTPINIAAGNGELLSTRDVNLLTTGRTYIQVNTNTYPINGELRGQINAIDPYRCDGSINNGTSVITLVFPPPPNLPPRNDSGHLVPTLLLVLIVLLSALLL